MEIVVKTLVKSVNNLSEEFILRLRKEALEEDADQYCVVSVDQTPCLLDDEEKIVILKLRERDDRDATTNQNGTDPLLS